MFRGPSQNGSVIASATESASVRSPAGCCTSNPRNPWGWAEITALQAWPPCWACSWRCLCCACTAHFFVSSRPRHSAVGPARSTSRIPLSPSTYPTPPQRKQASAKWTTADPISAGPTDGHPDSARRRRNQNCPSLSACAPCYRCCCCRKAARHASGH